MNEAEARLGICLDEPDFARASSTSGGHHHRQVGFQRREARRPTRVHPQRPVPRVRNGVGIRQGAAEGLWVVCGLVPAGKKPGETAGWAGCVCVFGVSKGVTSRVYEALLWYPPVQTPHA